MPNSGFQTSGFVPRAVGGNARWTLVGCRVAPAPVGVRYGGRNNCAAEPARDPAVASPASYRPARSQPATDLYVAVLGGGPHRRLPPTPVRLIQTC